MSGLVASGDRIHVITRRLFTDDVRRHFIGIVSAVAAGDTCEVQGYSFVLDSFKNEYLRQPELRTRFFNLGDARLIVNKLPAELDISEVQYRTIDGRLVITDSNDFSLEINEFGPKS